MPDMWICGFHLIRANRSLAPGPISDVTQIPFNVGKPTGAVYMKKGQSANKQQPDRFCIAHHQTQTHTNRVYPGLFSGTHPLSALGQAAPLSPQIGNLTKLSSSDMAPAMPVNCLPKQGHAFVPCSPVPSVLHLALA